jgi:hypothetical protein
MARINYVKKAQQRYRMVPVLNEDGTQKVVPVISKRTGEQKANKHGRPTVQRITVADTNQPLPMPTCGKCGITIEVGHAYKWVKVKSGPFGGRTMYRCQACPTWRESELTSSKMAGVYAAQEHLGDSISGCESVDDLSVLADDVARMIREVSEEYRESAENMEEGFGHSTAMSDELNEKADALEGWADEIECIDFDEFDEDDTEDDEDESEESRDARFEEWLEEQRQKLDDLVNDCPL